MVSWVVGVDCKLVFNGPFLVTEALASFELAVFLPKVTLVLEFFLKVDVNC